MVQVGDKAPAWRAAAYINGQVRELASGELGGRWLVLIFYTLDFTFVCPTELRGFAARSREFKALGAELVAASTDDIASHQAWFASELPEVSYPVLADAKKEIARAFGVLVAARGTAQRATFIVDPEGFVRYALASDANVGRSVDETLRVLEALKTGERCPADWRRGQKFV
jgi:peroxiredoxin 2/4